MPFGGQPASDVASATEWCWGGYGCTSYHRDMVSNPPLRVPDGLATHRRRVRSLGALAGLVPPVVLAAIGGLLLWGSDSGKRGLPGFVALVLGAPVLPLLGVPAEGGSGRYALAGLASTVLWLVIGLVAARRATRLPVAGWAEWRREYFPLAIGVWVGAIAALIIAGTMVGLGSF